MSVTIDVDDEPIPGLDDDGRPDPAYAQALGLVPAPAGRRSAAFALDATIWVVLAAPAVVGFSLLAGAVVEAGGAVASLDPASLALPLILIVVGEALTAIFGLVQLILHGRRALTVGKASFGLRSVGVRDFGPPGFWRVVLRVLVLWGSQVVVPFIGPAVLFASSSWDPESRGRSWLDRVGRCYVIDVRRGLDPFDARAVRHARRALAAPCAAESSVLPSLATGSAPDGELFIPAARSSSGVVASGADGAWAPPPISGTAPTSHAVASMPFAPSAPDASAAAAGRTPPTAPRPLARVIVFDDGTRLPVTGRGLIGRSPASAAGESPALLVPLVDDSMRISKTHAEFGVDETGIWIADRASRNGTVVELPGGATTQLDPGVRMTLPVGARVIVGGRSFSVPAEPER